MRTTDFFALAVGAALLIGPLPATAQTCPSGTLDCGSTDVCCPTTHPTCCPDGNTCCLSGAVCRPGGGCMAPGPTCDSGEVLCGDRCIPSGTVCCASAGFPGRYCPSGTTCRSDGSCSAPILDAGTSGGGGGGGGSSGGTCSFTSYESDEAGRTRYCTQAPCAETVGSVNDYQPGYCSTSSVLYCCQIDNIRSFIYEECGTSRCDNWDGPDGYRTTCEARGGTAYMDACPGSGGSSGGGSSGGGSSGGGSSGGGSSGGGSTGGGTPDRPVFGCGTGCAVGSSTTPLSASGMGLALAALLLASRRRRGRASARRRCPSRRRPAS